MPNCSINDIEFDIVYSDEEKNILKVNNKKEIFFEVFECSVFDDETLVLEQIGVWNDLPLVMVEFTKGNKKYNCEAVLVEEGETKFIVNENNLNFLTSIKKEEVIDEEIEKVDSVKEDLKFEINHTYDDKIKEYEDKKFTFLNDLELQFEEKITILKDDIGNKLDTFFEKLEDKKKELIEEEIDVISTSLNEKFSSFKTEVNQLNDFNRKNVDKILQEKVNEIDTSVKKFLDGLTKNYSKKFKDNDKKVTTSLIEINSLRNKFKKYYEISEEKNKNFLKIEEKIDNHNLVIKQNKELFEFINEEINNINEKFSYISKEENKKYNNLLAAVNKKDVVEYKTILKEKIQDVELGLVKEELKDELSEKFKKEVTSLKRYAEMAAGGGTNAVQYANGGTMNGTLNVNGNILSGGKNLDDIFLTETPAPCAQDLQSVTNLGNTTTNLISSNNTIVADTILATNLLSATNLDIGFELSGFNVTGNLSASGNISSGSLTTPALSTDGIDAKFTDNVIIAGDLDIGFPNENENQCIVIHGSASSGKRTMLKQAGDTFCISPQVGNQTLILGSGSNNVTCMCGNGSHELRIPNKVTIGTTGGTEKLTVAGNISASGNLSGADIKGTKIISTGDVELGGNILDANANELIQIDANDIKFVGKHVKAGFDVGVRNQRGCAKGIAQSNSSSAKFGIFNCSIEAITIDTAGKVGVGTTSPSEALTVSGNISAADINSFGTISIGNTPAYSQTRAIKVHDNGTQYASRVSLMGTGDNAGPAIEFVTDGCLAKRTLIRHEGEGSNDYGLGFFTTNNGTISEKVRFDGDGNVGIGTTSPGSKLEIVGETGSGGIEFSNSGSQSVKAYFNDANSSSDFIITRVGTGAAEITLQSDGEVILNPNNNNVGVGTTSPNENLTVVGNISATNTIASSAGHFADAVGIGTTSPEAKLDISYSGFAGKYARISRGTSNIDFDLDAGGVCMKSTVKTFYIGTCDSQPLRLLTNNSTRVCITETGNVGIGATTPGEKLTVDGNILASGGLSATEILIGTNNTATGTQATVAGGCSNIASGLRSTIGGGELNCATGSQATVAGGRSNKAIGNKSAVIGGQNNHACGNYSFTGGGTNNKTTGACASIIGGTTNLASGNHSIAGGCNSKATGAYSIALGGEALSATGMWSSVGGGITNCASANQSRVGGGCNNTASGGSSFIGGGINNLASGSCAFTGSGYSNCSTGGGSSIVGGTFNKACAGYSSVVGGFFNCAHGSYSSIVGGCFNVATGAYSHVGGGSQNCSIGSFSTVGGGYQVKARGNQSFAGGGTMNEACGARSFVGAGFFNCAVGNYTAVVGGCLNQTCGNESFIGGGYGNRTCSNCAIIVGGKCNVASGSCSIIIGGGYNYATGSCSIIVGGGHSTSQSTCLNCAKATHSGIFGGKANVVDTSHTCSFIIGTNITSNAACTTFVNNLSSQGILNGNSITSYEGVKIGGGSIISCNASFTTSSSDNGRTLLLDTTSGTITVSVTPQVSGFATRFIKEAGAAPIVFSTGNGLSGLYSYQDRNQLSIIYGQADILYKNENIAFLGGNLQ